MFGSHKGSMHTSTSPGLWKVPNGHKKSTGWRSNNKIQSTRCLSDFSRPANCAHDAQNQVCGAMMATMKEPGHGLATRLAKRSRTRCRSKSKKFRQDLSEKEERVINERIEKGSQLLSTMLNDICQQMLLKGEVYAQEDEASVIESVVARHLQKMDQNFLAVVDAYSKETREADLEITKLIDKVRKEILQQVNIRLPGEIQLIEKLLDMPDKKDRVYLIANYVEAENLGDVCSIYSKIVAATHQFITELEDSSYVLDRKMLARLCTIREEARLLEMEAYFREGRTDTFDLSGDVVSTYSIAFLQQLLRAEPSLKRTALLKKAFTQDWIGNPVDAGSDEYVPEKSITDDIVRPGSFMACLASAQDQMDRISTAEGVRNRVEEIRQEAMYALRLIGWGDFSTEEIEAYDNELEEMRKARENQAGSRNSPKVIDISDKDDEWIQKLTLSEAP